MEATTSERVPIPVAAKELGVAPASVREHMKRGIWDLGIVVSPQKSGKKIWKFYIYRNKLDKHLGRV